jgi:hypothetical protein
MLHRNYRSNKVRESENDNTGIATTTTTTTTITTTTTNNNNNIRSLLVTIDGV